MLNGLHEIFMRICDVLHAVLFQFFPGRMEFRGRAGMVIGLLDVEEKRLDFPEPSVILGAPHFVDANPAVDPALVVG
jgi:hypothetical protein